MKNKRFKIIVLHEDGSVDLFDCNEFRLETECEVVDYTFYVSQDV